MSDTSRLYSDLMQSWSKAQGEAWNFQAKWLKTAGAAFTDGSGDAEGMAEQAEADSPADEAWAWSRQAFDKWQKFLIASMPAGTEDGFGAEMLTNLMDPSAWLNIGINELNQSIENLAEGIDFGNLRQTERRFLETSREWLDLRQHSLRYRQIIIAAWARAFQRFTDTIGKDMLADGKAARDWRTVMNAWLEIANDELLKTQRSDEFLSAQRDLLRASIDFRTRQHGFIEEFCEANSIPTRSEVDDLHRTVTEMRRELRKLKRQLAAALSEAKAPASATRKPRKARRPAETTAADRPGTAPQPESKA